MKETRCDSLWIQLIVDDSTCWVWAAAAHGNSEEVGHMQRCEVAIYNIAIHVLL
jgi:hypothetical protein